MKRYPSVKGRARLSDAVDAGDPYRPAPVDRPRGARRKQIDPLNPDSTDRKWSWELEETDPELVGPPPRR